MNRNVKDIYLLILKKKIGKKILLTELMSQDWVGIMFDDCSCHVIPPLLDEKGKLMPVVVRKSNS